MIGPYTGVQHTQIGGFISVVAWRMDKKTSGEMGEQAASGRRPLDVLLDACRLLSQSTLHPFLSRCLPQRLASVGCSQGFPWLLTSTWVWLMGTPSWRSEEGRRESCDVYYLSSSPGFIIGLLYPSATDYWLVKWPLPVTLSYSSPSGF